MSPAPSDRSHLSIGEVLSLLQDEFPDVTISKIRFLESQGLLDPERTPSGYRKFYETDIERLRWILRQQKEHYLPLKVIKDRLDDLDVPPAEPAPPAGRRSSGPPATRPTAAAHRGGSAAGGAGAPTAERSVSSPTNGAGGLANGQAVRLSVDDRAAAPARPEPPPGATAPRDKTALRIDPRAPREPGGPREAGPELAAANGTPSTPVPGARPALPARPAGGPGDAAAHERVPSVSLTIDELAEASGMSARDLRELERFGLLEGQMVGDATYYDGDALVVARTAGGFLQHGIEARHLRTYKVAVDREAGLFEQLILPLLKQRNPDARRLAGRTVSELVHLGEVMRNVLLRRELRGHLDQ